MQPTDDGTLLRQYAENHSDEAFAALVTRHINLVYSVALRQVGDPHHAEEITQAVFILLAKKAAQLRHDKALSSWLFQATRLTASNFVRGETRRHRREQEAHMQSVSNESGGDIWPRIAPLLDDAVAELSEEDRHAIVLRFYEGRNLREVGAALGASEDAAEKRVHRAVEKLRGFFAKRGVTVGTSGLAVVISANAVQAAPAGLAVTISTAAALAGTTLATTATVTVTMTTLQNTLITATVAVLAGVGIYEARQASRLRDEVQTIRQQQAPLAEQIQKLQIERDNATNQLSGLLERNESLRTNVNELLRLRGQVAALNRELHDTVQSGQKIFTPQSRSDVNPVAEQILRVEKLRFVSEWSKALTNFASLNQGKFPVSLDQLSPLPGNSNTDHSSLPLTLFEIVRLESAATTKPGNIIVIREKQPWVTASGRWAKAYGFADGHGEIHDDADGEFQKWESNLSNRPEMGSEFE